LLGAACASSTGGGAFTKPSGPPGLQDAVVAEHAAQFDEKLAVRPAGSQKEFAAATYILGHLQAGGYTPLLDPVPVEDLVRSTNVVADPPRSADVTIVVAIPYDTGARSRPTGAALGLWLELARALYVKEPRHRVEFVALGAEHAAAGGGELGSRRLAEFLIERDEGPLVITIGPVEESGSTFAAAGTGADELDAVAASLDLDAATAPEPAGGPGSVFARAGFRQATVWGSVDGVGRVLLDFLAAAASPSPR
jgi:hypothetical protein